MSRKILIGLKEILEHSGNTIIFQMNRYSNKLYKNLVGFGYKIERNIYPLNDENPVFNTTANT